jgi:hypothetical protein
MPHDCTGHMWKIRWWRNPDGSLVYQNDYCYPGSHSYKAEIRKAVTEQELQEQVLLLVKEVYPDTAFACLSVDLKEGQAAFNVTPNKGKAQKAPTLAWNAKRLELGGYEETLSPRGGSPDQRPEDLQRA